VKAVLCPVCDGSGSLWNDVDVPPPITGTLQEWCHGCVGKGWVEVQEDCPGFCGELYTVLKPYKSWTPSYHIIGGDPNDNTKVKMQEL